ncbi:diguanylate cyclase (GGDEF)-like protein [Hypnocyclicus thermotrophus]|uniref:Diguanylate cyclase (GGDEF)-like protein n=1 Tax=Hypnocyclicus thermotrophus TaxID=1627895 RepID=A0AA46DZ20_9FUSO|nr:diguanylate cyclase [Hypnocyclicus thermotrophus]TDT71435.1 diguanylate cyclase (GGDEF)-like protein [Hypnocyclicus thermotrophus]
MNKKKELQINIISFLLVIIIITASYVIVREKVYKEIKNKNVINFLEITKRQDKEISHKLEKTLYAVEIISKNNELINYLKETKERRDILRTEYNSILKTLLELEKIDDEVYLVWLANDSANFYIDSNGTISDKNYDVKKRPWYSFAQTSNKAVFTTPYKEYTTKKIGMTAVKAIRKNDQIIGYIGADILIDSFENDLKNYVIGIHGFNFLLYNNEIILKSKKNINFNKNIINELNKKDYLEYFIDGNNFIFIKQKTNIDKLDIIQAMSLDEVMQSSEIKIKEIGAIFITTTILIVFIYLILILQYILSNKKIKNEALTDYLTKTFNRKGFLEETAKRIVEYQKENTFIACCTIDIDNFKSVNDTFGHDIGDKALIIVTNIIKEFLKNEDILSRYGGDEFVAIFFDKKKEYIMDKLEKIRQKIMSTYITADEEILKITLSIGVAFLEKDDNIERLIKKSDEALYKAKEEGKNKIVEYKK